MSWVIVLLLVLFVPAFVFSFVILIIKKNPKIAVKLYKAFNRKKYEKLIFNKTLVEWDKIFNEFMNKKTNGLLKFGDVVKLKNANAYVEKRLSSSTLNDLMPNEEYKRLIKILEFRKKEAESVFGKSGGTENQTKKIIVPKTEEEKKLAKEKFKSEYDKKYARFCELQNEIKVLISKSAIDSTLLEELKELIDYFQINMTIYWFTITKSEDKLNEEHEFLNEVRKIYIDAKRSNSTPKWWWFLKCEHEPSNFEEYELSYKKERLRLKKAGEDITSLNAHFEENKKRFK